MPGCAWLAKQCYGQGSNLIHNGFQTYHTFFEEPYSTMVGKDDILAQFLVLYAKAAAYNTSGLLQLSNKKRERTHRAVHMGNEDDIMV